MEQPRAPKRVSTLPYSAPKKQKEPNVTKRDKEGPKGTKRHPKQQFLAQK